MITIEKNVPIPAKRRAGGAPCLYPWKDLEVGDSFVFPSKIKKATASSLSYRAGKEGGRKFAIRLMADGIRCWRTA